MSSAAVVIGTLRVKGPELEFVDSTDPDQEVHTVFLWL